jgi:hypothetical protein
VQRDLLPLLGFQEVLDVLCQLLLTLLTIHGCTFVGFCCRSLSSSDSRSMA